MNYFDISGLIKYPKLIKEKYSRDSEATKIFNDTRAKINYFAELLSKKTGTRLINNYNERINKMAGQGTNFHNYKDYILVGFVPDNLDSVGSDIFIKIAFGFWEGYPNFHFQLDINYKKGEENQYLDDRDILLDLNPLWIPVDDSFPNNWNELCENTHAHFKQLTNDLLQYLKVEKESGIFERYRDYILPIGYTRTTIEIYYDCAKTLVTKSWKSKFNSDLDEYSYTKDTLLKLRNISQEKFSGDFKGKVTFAEFINKMLSENHDTQKKERINYPLNQILYGPPGTGKTYATKKLAVEIIDKTKFDDSMESRDKILSLYDQYSQKQQIKFTTFHQSLSYEDFIEGIKPVMNNDEEVSSSVNYKLVSGIFKTCCALSAYNCYKIYKENENSDSGYTFDELHEAFLEYSRNNKQKIYPSISGKPIEIFDINKNDSIRAKAQSSTASHVAPLTKENLQKLYDVFSDADEIKNLQQIKDAVGISPRMTEFYAIFKGLKEFEKNEFQPNEETSSEIIEEILDEEDIVKKFDAGVFNNAVKSYAKYAKPIVLIVDEINRGNVSQVFGELITLLEDDKRMGSKEVIEAVLPYSKSPFAIPANLYIIGTMNTADRSVEALDTALRRRFSFTEVLPDYNAIDIFHPTNGIIMGISPIDLVKILKAINERIEILIDKDHQIGQSYLIKTSSLKELKIVFENKILPLLEEYFYGDFGKIGLVLGERFVSIKNKTSLSNKAVLAKFPGYEDIDFITDKKVYQIKNIGELTEEDFISIYQTAEDSSIND